MRKLYLATAVALTGLLLAGCSAGSASPNSIQRAIEAADTSLVLSDLAPDNVTGFLIVCPYESADSVADRLGFTWSDAPDYSTVDGRQTIAFVDHDQVASHAELSRDDVDFCGSDQWDVLPIETALTVSHTADAIQILAPA